MAFTENDKHIITFYSNNKNYGAMIPKEDNFNINFINAQ